MAPAGAQSDAPLIWTRRCSRSLRTESHQHERKRGGGPVEERRNNNPLPGVSIVNGERKASEAGKHGDEDRHFSHLTQADHV